MDEFERGIDKAQSKFSDFSSRIQNLSKGAEKVLKPAVEGFEAVESVGKKAGDAITTGLKGFAAAATAVGGFGAAAVQSGMQFDATMSQVSAISGATGKDFDALRDKALEMGAKTKFSASEAGEAMTYMAMAGWKTGDMLGGIEGIMNLAAASGEDLATTSDIVTDALTAFGMQASDSGHFADILAAASSNANTNVGMMGETFKYAAPLAGAMGYTAEDTALAIGLMANSGIKASQAGTSLRSIMTRLAKPTKESSAAMEALGISITNSDGSMKPFGTTISELRTAFSGLSEEQKASYAAMLGGQEAMSGLLAIVNAAPADVEKLTIALNDCNGAAAEMAATMVDNLQGDLTLLGSAFESLQIAISDSLTPTLREFAQFGQKAMANLLEGFQGGGVSGFMDALSGLVTEGVTMLAEKAPEFTRVSLQFIQAMADGILGARFEILEAGNSILITLSEGISSWLSSHGAEMQEFGTGIVRLIFQGFLAAGDIISENIGQFIPLIASAFFSYHEALFTVGADILGAIGKGIVESKDEIRNLASETITNIVTSLRDNAPMIIEGGIALLEALVGAIQDNIPLIGETAVEIVVSLATGLGESLPELIPAAVDMILELVDTLTSPSSLSELVGAALQLIKGLADGLIAALPELSARLPEIIANIVDGLVAAVPQIIAVGGEIIAGLALGLVQAIPELLLAIPRLVGALVDGFCELLGIHSPSTVFAGFGENIVDGLLNGISETWGSVVEFFGGAVEDILGFFTDLPSKLLNIGENIVGGLQEGISGAWRSFTGWFGEKIGGIVTSAADALGIHSPSRVFEGIGKNVVLGLENGVSGEDSKIDAQMLNVVESMKSAFAGLDSVFMGIGQNAINALSGGLEHTIASLQNKVATGLSNLVIAKANSAIIELDEAIQAAGGNVSVGELMTSRYTPAETGWLLCDGSAVPAGYTVLSAMLDGMLPNIPGDRYKTYIFGGAPKGG